MDNTTDKSQEQVICNHAELCNYACPCSEPHKPLEICLVPSCCMNVGHEIETKCVPSREL